MAEESAPGMSHLLDTSALLAWYRQEAGEDEVRRLVETEPGTANVSVFCLTEARTRILQLTGDQSLAEEITDMWMELFPDAIPFTRDLIRLAADLKAAFAVSFADAGIAATAIGHDLTLVHKDPDFDTITDPRLKVIRLPYKKPRKP